MSSAYPSSFRFSPQIHDDLVFLCQLTNRSQSQVVCDLIHSEAERFRSDPELSETLNQLYALSDKLKQLVDY